MPAASFRPTYGRREPRTAARWADGCSEDPLPSTRAWSSRARPPTTTSGARSGRTRTSLPSSSARAARSARRRRTQTILAPSTARSSRPRGPTASGSSGTWMTRASRWASARTRRTSWTACAGTRHSPISTTAVSARISRFERPRSWTGSSSGTDALPASSMPTVWPTRRRRSCWPQAPTSLRQSSCARGSAPSTSSSGSRSRSSETSRSARACSTTAAPPSRGRRPRRCWPMRSAAPG